MKITTSPSKILSNKVAPVANIDDRILALVEKMRQAMINNRGVGLAANQVAHNLQIFVIDAELAREHGVPDAFVNPKLNEFSRESDVMEEGCLSLPDFWTPVKRSKKVRLKALTLDGKKIKIKARGFLSRVLQHEYDHLQGILIKDRKKK